MPEGDGRNRGPPPVDDEFRSIRLGESTQYATARPYAGVQEGEGMDRRRFLQAGSVVTAMVAIPDAIAGKANGVAPTARPRPTVQQLAWQRDELAMFVHFTVNTFTGKEWGEGDEDPKVFNPDRLDARQWAKA